MNSSHFNSLLFVLSTLSGALFTSSASAQELDRAPTVWEESGESYRVRFTNPVCRVYKYSNSVRANDGSLLTQKPKNAFCTPKDGYRSGRRANSPESEVLKMINDRDTKEIFLAFLSYSNRKVHKALCKASKERKVKITLVMDNARLGPSRNDEESISRKLRVARLLEKCTYQDSNGRTHGPKVHQRGHEGSLGYAHNKLIMTNPNNGKMKLAYGSANLSSGVVLHHENWHFVTIPSKTFFAQIHICLRDGMIDHGHSKRSYAKYLSSCRAKISSEMGLIEESDVKTFFVPGSRKVADNTKSDGSLGLSLIMHQINQADMIDIAAHRMKQKKLFNAIAKRTKNGGLERSRMVVDDDVYWTGTGDTGGYSMPNTRDEYGIAKSMMSKGVKFGFMETNHAYRLLHHNKYLIFYRDNSPYGVWAGAGNFTTSAFTKNYENFYFIKIPSVAKAFANQYDYVFGDLATPKSKLPKLNTLPQTGIPRS